MISAALLLVATLALGAFSGVLGGLFGIGGGVLAIPLFGLLYGLDQQVAQGTTLVMVVPNVALGFWRYRRRVGVDLRIAGTLAASALASTYPAARFATGLDPHGLRLGFAAFLGSLAALVAYRTWRGSAGTPRRVPLVWGGSAFLGVAGIGIAGGIVSGLFGVGGAFIAPPALTAFFGLRQAEAQGLALALVAPGTAVALAAYAEVGQVAWHLGIPLAIGGTAAISLGVAAAHRLPERRLRYAFCGLLTVTAGLLALHG